MSTAEDLKNKSYEQIWKDWNAKFPFGTKGEMTLSEARQVHNKWKKLGTLAARGLL